MRSDRVLLAHGSGGTMMRELIEDVFIARFDDEALLRMDDAASLEIPPGRIALTTDTYVVTPALLPRRRHRAPGRRRHRQRRLHGGRHAAVPHRRLRPRGGPADRGAAPHPRLDGDGGRRGRRAHRHRRHEGRRARPWRRHLHQHRRRGRRCATGVDLSSRYLTRRRRRAALRHARRPRHRGHVDARGARRSAPTSSPTPRR